MENELTAALDQLLTNSNKNYQRFLSCIAYYLRQNTDFYSGDYEQIIRAAFDHSDNFSEEISLQSNKRNIQKANTCIVPATEAIDDIFGDETQFDGQNDAKNVSNETNDSVIIPETQFDPNDSIGSDISGFFNERFKSNSSRIDENGESSVENATESNAEENGDFFKVAADPNDCEPQISSLESQPIMANLDRTLLVDFLSSDGEDCSKVAKQSDQMAITNNNGSTAENRRQTGEMSGSTTPDLDFEGKMNKSTASTKMNLSNQSAAANELVDTEDLFSSFTQPTPKDISLKNQPDGVTLVANEAINVVETTPEELTATTNGPTFAKPIEPPKKKKSIVAHNDSDSFFEMATQRTGLEADGNVSVNDDDIFDMATQQVVSNDIYDAATQLQPSESDDIFEAATQLQSDMNDVFDVPTQRLNVRNGSKSPEPEPSRDIPLGQRRVKVFESQLSPIQTPEWSVAKLLPKEPTKVIDKPISKKEENLARKQQWLFNMSDDEEDNDNEDLEFDITPNRQNSSVRLSMLNSPNKSQSDARKSSPMPQQCSKTVNNEEPKLLGERKADNKTPVSNSVLKPTKRIRSLSIILSRDEVSEYFKGSEEENMKSVSSKLMEKSKRKAGTPQTESSAPESDVKSKTKTETTLNGGSDIKPKPKANKRSQTPPKDIPVTRNLRTKNNNNKVSVIEDDGNTLKRKNRDIDTEIEQNQPRKRATKDTKSLIPAKFRTYQTEPKVSTKKLNQKKGEKIKEPAKDTKKIKPKIEKPPKAAPVARESSSHSISTSVSSRRHSIRISRPNSTVHSPVNILFTKINPKPHVQNIKSLGGFIVDTPQLGTILICDTALRTFKFLYAIIKGIPIVSSKWLDASYKMGFFVPVNPFLLADIEAEKRFHFSLKTSLEISPRIKLFEKYKFMATPHSQPIPNEIAELVRCGGGQYLFNPSGKFEADQRTVLVTNNEDKKLWRKYQRMYADIMIVSSEGFMQSILQQKINFKHYIMR